MLKLIEYFKQRQQQDEKKKKRKAHAEYNRAREKQAEEKLDRIIQ